MIITIVRPYTLAAEDMEWWESQTKEFQKKYIAAHPNSKYAKASKYKKQQETVKKSHKPEDHTQPKHKVVRHKKPAVVKSKIREKCADKIKRLAPADREFFDTDQHQPNSEKRKAFADHIRTSHKEILAHMKGQVTEWKDGCKAIHKLATGEKLDDHHKKALKSLVKDAVITTAAIAITGGFSHGIALALKHVGFDVLKDVVLKSVIKSTAKANAASFGHTGMGKLAEHWDTVLNTITASDRGKVMASSKATEERILKELLDKIADMIESGEIPDDAWDKAIDDLEKSKKAQQRNNKK